MNAFVTGGSRGIGRAIVLKFIQEGYGCAFSYNSNSQAADDVVKQARAINPDAEIRSYQLDQAHADQVEKVVEQAQEDFGEIEVLVNNAAINRNNAAAFMSNEEWDSVIQTNLSGPFYFIRQFLMSMIGSKYGRIINISSLAQTGSSGQASYAASKGGLVTLSSTIAREYGAKGITSNIVTVGYVETDMTETYLAQKLSKIWMEYCPMKRVGKADEIADLVYYLTTEKAGFINGETICVSGGLTYVP
ncbi:MAG: hypothetical protein B0D92_00255 [Spirochaeta sp. LUC14_002_19_P3]|nr:MAG: hypothetical protein B0D92_00255 [Spirochaeta sp. LUC14_002_19_P3]